MLALTTQDWATLGFLVVVIVAGYAMLRRLDAGD